MSYDETKHNTIIELFKQGKTLREIGAMYSVTGERIRAILARHGVTGKSGGRAARIAKAKAEKAERREKAFIEKYGCTSEQFRDVCGSYGEVSRSAYRAFSQQQNSAAARGVEWKLKFWDWYSVWQESGKWEERGRGVGGYCMCRFGDEGAYELGNVYIDTFVHNSTLGRTLAHEQQKRRTPVYLAVMAAGGRKAVSEAIGVDRNYLSQLANDGYLPRCWLDDGRAKALAELTCGAFSPDDLAALCRAPEVEAA